MFALQSVSPTNTDPGLPSGQTKVVYAMPTLSTVAVAQNWIPGNVLVFYNLMGTSLTGMTAMIAIARCIDVLSDPAMSYLRCVRVL